ncbi:MAG: DUF1360 domain-containing protein [Gaiellales bacterium]|nr:MAG: DUF1360 domain-containing protein [Gaiellales bacterium]
MAIEHLLILALATWRASHMAALEEGFFSIGDRWRRRMGAFKTVEGFWTAPHWWGRMWSCPLCLSIWIAPAMIYLFVSYSLFYWIALVLAVSGAASALELMTRR